MYVLLKQREIMRNLKHMLGYFSSGCHWKPQINAKGIQKSRTFCITYAYLGACFICPNPSMAFIFGAMSSHEQSGNIVTTPVRL